MFQPWHFCVLAGLLAISARLALLPWVPIPVPVTHDEFSYLLGADTFASGRLTNAAHPMWVHFETFHVNPLPTYCSKYPPAQALVLGVGQRLWGHPWFGVCLSMGLMFAAVCWMLQGWVTLQFAVLTTLLSILTWGLAGPWIDSYWGGCVAACGGALVIGAIPRLVQRPGLGAVLAASAGLAVLANSRPFEGLVVAAGATAVFVWQARRAGRPRHLYLTRRLVIPFLLVGVSAAAAMGYYNYRTTGSPLTMPYQVNQRMYGAPSIFYVFALPPPAGYRHENIRRFWQEWVRPRNLEARARPWVAWRNSGINLGLFYLASPFGVAILIGVFLGWGPKVRAALAVIVPLVFFLAFIDGAEPHYLAPAFGALLIIGAAGLERVGRWEIAGIVILAGLLGIVGGWGGLLIKAEARRAKAAPTGIATRPELIKRLERQPGQQLVIVRYGADHDVHQEWVYNRANIDAAKIVWAQDMGEEKNRELLNYFPGRTVWLLEPDTDPLTVRTYE